MGQNTTQNLRTVALVGHGAVGKTTLVEALLATSGAITNRGSVEKGNTICDFDPQEKEFGHSINSAVVHLKWQGAGIHMIDTPGFPDFAGQAIGSLMAVDTVLVVVNAQTGIEPATGRMMKRAETRNLARIIVINKMDAENVDLAKLVEKIQDRFGAKCMPLNLPTNNAKDVINCLANTSGESDFGSVTDAHRALIDQIVEEDEDLLNQYLEDGEDPSLEKLVAPLKKAMVLGNLVPIVFTSARTGVGVKALLDVLEQFSPNPAEACQDKFYKVAADGSKTPVEIIPDPSKHVVAHVFKVVSDPYVGKLGIFRVYQGTIKKDLQLFVSGSKRPFKVGHLYYMQGKDYVETDSLVPGDIGAIAKIEELEFNSILHDSPDQGSVRINKIEYPLPMQGLAVTAKKKGDEQRLFDTLRKLELEDPCFVIERNATTGETVIRGLGEMHLRAKLTRMAQQYKVELDTKPPKIAYRETVTGKAEGHCRHKKQSGGAGQFGEVMLKVEPMERGKGFEFVDSVKGGVIPGVFMAAVEKGVRQALEDGVVGGFPVHDVRVIVYDGKSHPVDSKDIAFYSAGRKATIEAIKAATPIILEPIVNIEVLAPDASIGDLAGDLSSKRGQVTGTQPHSTGMSAINGKVPLAELDDYQGRLKSLTAGQGFYTIEFSHFAPVPIPTQQQLAAQRKTTTTAEDD